MTLSLVMIPFILSTTFFFVDSYSLTVWDRETSVGPAPITLRGVNAFQFAAQIRPLPDVTRVSYLNSSWASILSLVNNTIPSPKSAVIMSAPGGTKSPYTDVRAASISADFATEFPTIFLLSAGRYPQNDSEIALLNTVANQLGIGVGDTLRYGNTTGVAGPGGALFRYEVVLNVVGIYSYAEMLYNNPLPYSQGDVIVCQDLLGEISRDCWVYVGIDGSKISPLDPVSSLATLTSIDESIRELDPLYSGGTFTPDFYLQDSLIGGIQSYVNWHNAERYSSFMDFIPILFVGFAISFLSSGNYYWRRKEEVTLLFARGGSRSQVARLLETEIFGLSAIALAVGLVAGLLLSQWALFLLGEPSLYSLSFAALFLPDALVLIVGTSLVVPGIFIFFTHEDTLNTEKTDRFTGRLGKVSRISGAIRLDFVLAIVTVLVVLTGVQLALSGAQYSFIAPILIVAPLAFLIAIASIVSRFGSRITMALSAVVERINGRQAARIGSRSLGQKNVNAIPFILLSVLIVSMLWTTLLVNDNAASSYLGQTRFSIGGDVTIKLSGDKTGLWDSFMQNVSLALPGSSMSTVIEQTMFLSANLEGAVSFYSIDPLAYSKIGYNYEGVPIEDTPLKGLLETLTTNVSGAIVTQDVADEFQLSVGGSLRGFLSNGTGFDVMLFTVIGIVPSLPDILVLEGGYISPLSPIFPETVGESEVWVNNVYASKMISPQNSTASYLCIRLNDPRNVTQKIDQIKSADTQNVIDKNGIAIAAVAAGTLLRSEPFLLSFSYNALKQIILIVSLPVLAILLAESVYGRRRAQRHVQFTLGYSTGNFNTIAIGQSTAIFLLSTLMALIVTPVVYYAGLGLYIWGYYPYLRGFPELFIVTGQVASMLLIIGLLALVSISYLLAMILVRRHYGLNSAEEAAYLNLQWEVHT